MNSDRKNNLPPGPSSGGNSANQPLVETEPTAGRAQAPIWLVVLFGVVFYWAQLYLDNYAGGFNPQVYGPYHSYKQVADANPKSGPEALIALGEALYVNCAACHMPNGAGNPGQTPPLAESEWVTAANPARIIRIVLHGPTGPFKVKDQDWNTSVAMPPFGSAFSDEQIAGILSYIRQNFGNKAAPVTPEQVKAAREETAGRAAAWTMDELLKIPDTL